MVLPDLIYFKKWKGQFFFFFDHYWYGSTIKKAECRRIDAFELWCWRRLLRVPRTGRRSNQSILKEMSPEYSLEGLILKLKLQYFGLLMQRTDSLKRPWCWERLKAGGEGDNRGWDGWMASLTRWTWVWVGSFHGVAKDRTWLSNWTNWCESTVRRQVKIPLQRCLTKSSFLFHSWGPPGLPGR